MQQTAEATQIEELDQRLAALAENLLTKRDEAVQARAASGVERRWREDQAAFEGMDATLRLDPSMMDFATGNAWQRPNEPRRSKVIVNIIRGKCNTTEGRFAEIMLPTDDQNYGILPSKVATLAIDAPQMSPQVMAGAMGSQGSAPSPSADPVQAQQQAQEEAKKKSSLMEDEIGDQLGECEFNGECRKVVRQSVRLGTGILKGPNVVKRIRRSWTRQEDQDGSVYVMQAQEEMAPSSKWVDCWNVYPDYPNCGDNPQRGAFIWELDYVLPRDLRKLIGVPGYNRAQIGKVLREEPKRTIVKADKGGTMVVQQTYLAKGGPFERWEYHGDVDREDLDAMGCRCPDDDAMAFSACVVFVNDRPIKVTLNMLDTGQLPYDFFQWEPVADSPWGIGEPRKIMWQQRVMTGAWRAMMDNAGDSAGGIFIMGKDVVPEDGVWDFTSKKAWIDEGDDPDVRKAFSQYQIQNNQVELQNIIELALRFTDMESGTPMLAQGERGSSPETLGGMQLLMQGADVSRRQQVKLWDDKITRPHIKRYYDWNMQYSAKDEIKGDFEVDARGTSVLLVKDQAAQSLQQVFALRNDPELRLRIDWDKALEQLFDALHLDILKSEEEYQKALAEEQNKQPAPAPQVEVAHIRAESAEKIKAYELRQESEEAEKDRQAEIAIQMISEKMTSTELSSAERQAFDKLKVLLATTSMKLKTQRDLSAAERSSQVIDPGAEPAGQAEPGHAFTQ